MKKIILLAGGGDLPNQVIDSFKNKKISIFCISFEKNSIPKNINRKNHKVINFGEVITELKKLQKNGFKKIIMIGNLNRPKIHEIKPDLNSIKLIPEFTKTLLSGGDNYLLNFVINKLHKIGFTILDMRDVLPNNFLGKGNQTITNLSSTNKQDIKKGKLILDTISKFDIGQSLVIGNGNVIGIETIHGTDYLIKSCSLLKNNSKDNILIKLVKKKQNLKVDLPTIGLKTLKNCKANSIGGIAYTANKTLFVNKNEIIDFCNSNKIFLYGI